MFWILRPLNDKLWEPWYDKSFGFVVSAPSEEDARLVAAANCGEEGIHAWTLPSNSSCVPLVEESELPYLVMGDFASV